MGNGQLLIWDCENKLPSDSGFTVFWQSYIITEGVNGISIPLLVEENADQLRSQYLAMIYKLGEVRIHEKRVIDCLKVGPGFSFWWMTLLSEKCNYSKSPQINNMIKLMAFNDWLENEDYRTIKLVSANSALADSIRFLTVKLGVEFEWEKIAFKKSTDGLVRKLYDKSPNFFKAIVSLVHYLMDRWKLKGLGIEKWKKSSGTISFISYFFNIDSGLADENRYKSAYWSELPEILEKKNVQSNWLHIYVKNELVPTASSAKKLIEKFNNTYKDKQNHLLLDSFLSLSIINKTIVSWLRIMAKHRKIKKALEEQADYFWPLIEMDVRVSLLGVVAIKNLLFYYLFNEAMKLIPSQKRGVYLQENQGWEFGFISAWKEFGHGDLIGMPHSTVRYWDLRYYFDPRSYKRNNSCDLPLPDKVGVNGEAAKKSYIDSGYSVSDLVEVEALRYLQLEKTVNHKEHPSMVENMMSVLVLGDYLQKNTVAQMKLLQRAFQYIRIEVQFIVKPHPGCPILSEDYPGLEMLIVNKPIYQLLDKCMVVYTSAATSAAVDAYCFGKQVVTMLDPEDLNLSPLREKDNVIFITTELELAKALNNMDKVKDIVNQGSNYFYLDTTLPRWSDLLNLEDI